MDPLDLSVRPPRRPRELLGDLELFMMARTVDKLRAQLPGGNIGPYKIAGMSLRLLRALEVTEDDLRAAVAQAATDQDVVEWLREHTDEDAYFKINMSLEEATIADALKRDETFAERYPIIKTLTPETTLFDMLVADDQAMFAKK